MGLYDRITVSPTTEVLIWKIQEEESVLSKDIVLTDNCVNRMSNMKSEIHRRGFLSVRHLLKAAGYKCEDLYYDDFGKPHLSDGKHISITHSFTFSGIIVSNENVGIDIEMRRDKILKIAHKFTPLREYRTLANADAVIRKLTIVWCAKESLYKIHQENGLRFLEHIYVEDFAFDSGKTTANISYKNIRQDYNISFLEFEDFTCAYALES